jgi:hypothetical protein
MYAPQPEEKHPEQRIFSQFIYVVSAMGAISQYAESIGMVVAGCLILGLAGFMVKAQRATAHNTIYASHVEWAARTMYIGTFFLFPISIAAMLYFVYTWTDIAGLKQTLLGSSEDLSAQAGIVKEYIVQNEAKINRITTWCISPPIFWWVRRCWYGIMRADKSEPIDYPDGIF